MKYCYTCRTRWPDTFLFCSRCGATFDVKLCRKLHPHSRYAEYCRVCGSSALSTPHNRPQEWRAGIIVAMAGALLIVLVALLWVVSSAPKDDGIRSGAVLLGMVACAGVVVVWSWFKGRT